jgi:hypothetical protein
LTKIPGVCCHPSISIQVDSDPNVATWTDPVIANNGIGAYFPGEATAMEKFAARKIRLEIDRILFEVWDPIGVNQISLARHEYSGYVAGVFELLAVGASDEAIAEHLLRIATDLMGLTGLTVPDMLPTLGAIRAINLPSE